MTGAQIIMDGLAFGESPRWHDGRLWFCNWGTQQVIRWRGVVCRCAGQALRAGG